MVAPVQAAVRTRYGPPDVVRIAEVNRPVPKDHELLVRIHATTVNRTDCGLRAAKPFIVRFFTGLTRPRVTVLGSEFAGEVVAVGSQVTSFRPGDRVFGYDDSRCGAHAEYKAIAEDGPVATLPTNLTFEEAAAATEGSHYALAFIQKAKIESGQSVLINGATGAIGSAAVQLIKGFGGRVTAVCATEQVALVEGLGADRVIDYRVEDFTKDQQRYDVVLDSVGKSSFGRCRHLLKPGGIYSSSDLGPLSQNPMLALVTPLFRERKVLFAIPRIDQEMVRYLRDRIEAGVFRPVIDRRYPFDHIAEAYRYVETGQKVGNVVITMSLEEPS
jgi:NADPH:quinone reductase-like Zn-dependent oxidoreductase